MSPASAPDLDFEVIRRGLVGRRVGRDVQVLGRVGSTMDIVAAHADDGAREGLAVIADHQAAGRGRQGRTWEAPPGTALALSVLLRPSLPATRLSQLPMAMGLAARSALAERLPENATVALKWPNDILVGGRKIGGLLAETAWSARDDRTPRVVLGLGINVHQTAEALPCGATSLRLALGDGESPASGARGRDRLAVDILRALDGAYERLLDGADLVDEWSAALATIGRWVSASGVGGEVAVEGEAVGVTPDGALRIRTADGEVTVRAGDVTLSDRRTYAPGYERGEGRIEPR